jgi:hypothetical protein
MKYLWFKITPNFSGRAFSARSLFKNIPGPCSPGYYLGAPSALVEECCWLAPSVGLLRPEGAGEKSAWGGAKRSPRNPQKKRSSAESASEYFRMRNLNSKKTQYFEYLCPTNYARIDVHGLFYSKFTRILSRHEP